LGNTVKKYLTAGLMAACLTVPAFAGTTTLASSSPDEPVHRRALVLCVALIVGLHAYKRRLTREEQMLAAYMR
jgi:hypothetical protein